MISITSKSLRLCAGAVLLLALVIYMTGCSPFYVMRAAYEQGKLIAAREDIAAVIADPRTTPETRQKLSIVVEAREFSKTLALTPGDSFTMYADIGRDAASWVVVASRKDSFTLKTWWFPIVGSVPYKGYFDKEDAIEEAKELAEDGYETWVRGADAFSTLGWFNDPVLSTTLRNDQVQIANTVIHEILHSTVWIPNYVEFNESLANFVAYEGNLMFFEAQLEKCDVHNQTCRETTLKQIEQARYSRDREYEIAEVVQALYSDLDTLYTSSATMDEKLSKREEVFKRHVQPLRERYPNLKILTSVNNAEVIQLKIYLTKLHSFLMAFQQDRRDWAAFLKRIEEIKLGAEDGKEPYQMLEGSKAL